MSELDKALAIRAELMARCHANDVAAAELREQGKELDVITRARFRELDELRLIERAIARMKEDK